MDLSGLTRDQLWQVEEIASAALEFIRPSDDPKIEAIRASIVRCKHRHPPAMSRGDLERLADDARKRAYEAERIEREKAQAERERAQKERAARSPGSVRVGYASGGWTLRQESIKCGKEGCDKLHGPYWYGYKTIAGKVRKRYFGKMRPGQAALDKAEAALLGKRAPRPSSTPLPKKGRRSA